MLNIEELRKIGTCVFLAAEASVARDISTHIMDAADEIEQFRAQLDNERAAHAVACQMRDEAVAEIGRLRAALKLTATRRHVQLVAGGLEAANGESCLLCKAQCGYGEKLQHVSGCLLASGQHAREDGK